MKPGHALSMIKWKKHVSKAVQVKKHGSLLLSLKKKWTLNTVGWLKTMFKEREREGKAGKCGWKPASQCTEYPVLQAACCGAQHGLTFPFGKKKKIPPFACINILLLNLNYVTAESSFDGERKRQASLINLFSKHYCGGLLPLLSPLWQPQLHTAKCLVQQYARSLFSFEVTALISSVSNC